MGNAAPLNPSHHIPLFPVCLGLGRDSGRIHHTPAADMSVEERQGPDGQPESTDLAQGHDKAEEAHHPAV